MLKILHLGISYSNFRKPTIKKKSGRKPGERRTNILTKKEQR